MTESLAQKSVGQICISRRSILNKKLSDDFQVKPGGQFQKSRRTIKSPKLANYLFCYDNIQSIYDIIKDDPISSKNS